MSNPRVLPVQQSAGAITFTVLVEGQEVPDTLEFLNITTHKEVNKVPFARIILHDGSAAEEDFEISNQNTFLPGKSIEIQSGYDSQNETVFKGIIIKHSIKIKENSGSVLQVECRDEVIKTTVGRKSAYYNEKKDSDVIEEILGNYGLSSDVEATSLSHFELVQYYCTDWDFILSRAEMNGMLVIVSDGEVKVAKPEVSRSVLELIYGATLYEFEAEIDARLQFSSVKSSSWDYKNQEVIEKAAAAPTASPSTPRTGRSRR